MFVVGIGARPGRIVVLQAAAQESSLTSFKWSGAELSLDAPMVAAGTAQMRGCAHLKHPNNGRLAGSPSWRRCRSFESWPGREEVRECRPRYPMRMRFSVFPQALGGALNSMMSCSGRRCGGLLVGGPDGSGRQGGA